jgi:NAD(P)-dependent dehydrogenase (short-subunit alcohol dehydrogenase family)
MGRAADPSKLAGPLILLASKASGYITGIILRVDDGYAYCGIELPD